MQEQPLFFLQDFAQWLYENSGKARQDRNQSSQDRSADRIFAEGRAQAYYEVFSHFVNQAKIYSIPSNLLHLEGIDPDELLT